MDKMDYIVPADSPTTTTTDSFDNCEVGKTAPAKAPLRSRNGCQTCRKRKVKCDEKKPICTHCSHLGQSCDYSNQLQWKEPKFTKNKNVKADVLAVRGNVCWDPPSPRHFNLSLPPTPTHQSIPPLAAAVTDEGREWIADKYDKMGNCIYNYSPRYFDSLVAHNCYSGWPSEIGAGAGGRNVSSVAARQGPAQGFNTGGDGNRGVGTQEHMHLQLLQQQEQTQQQQQQQQQYSKTPHRETKRRKSNATALALGGDPISHQRPQVQIPALAPATAAQTQQYTSSAPAPATSAASTTGATQPTAMNMRAMSAELPNPSASSNGASTSTTTSKHHPRNIAAAAPPPRQIKSKRRDKSGTSSPNDGRSSSNSGHSSGSVTSGSGSGGSGSSSALSTSSASTSKSGKSSNNKKTLGASKPSSAAAASAAKASNKDPYAGSALAEMLGLQ